MSKQIKAMITCKNCSHHFEASLYRSIWIEYPENRRLITEDSINRVTCPKCKELQRLEFPFLCTNVKQKIAIWYEPYYDSAIDDDIKLYAAQFGNQSFYALAPRIADWDEFKSKLIEMENSQTQSDIPKTAPKERQIIPRYIESDDSLLTTKPYPKFVSHLQKRNLRLIYSFIPVIVFFTFIILNGASIDFVRDLFPIVGVTLLFSFISFVILTVIHIAILEAKPWRSRSKVFRLWCFISGCWTIGIPVIKMFSDDGFPDFGSDSFIYMLLVMTVPPALIGIATYIYQKYIK